MQPNVPLDQMTTLEKLRALEEIWQDLQGTPAEVPFPAWHADVLAAREGRVRKGASQFHEWPQAKRDIRDRSR